MFGWFKKLAAQNYAFTMWVTAWNGRKVKIGVPVGMSVGELEDQLHERYWTAPTDSIEESSE